MSELESRQNELRKRLIDSGHEAALIQTPVDLYYYAGGRQNGTLFVQQKAKLASLFAALSQEHDMNPVEMIRRTQSNLSLAWLTSLKKLVVLQPCSLRSCLIHLQIVFLRLVQLLIVLRWFTIKREIKSEWELQMMAEGAEIQMAMFEAVESLGGEGVSEIELVAAAEAGRAAGFAGNVQMRR